MIEDDRYDDRQFLEGRQPECALMTAFDLSELFVL